MSKEPVARGIGPLRPVAGRAWARDFTSRKEAGLAGEACRGTGPKAGKPTVTRGFLHSQRDRVKGDVVATSTVERNRAPPMTTAVRSPDTASSHNLSSNCSLQQRS
ncbi:hypothetical protein YC2023_073509 [Brassica napus]